jgi:serine protease Do
VGALPPMVASTKPGTEVQVEILRQGEPETLHVVVGEFAGEQAALDRSFDPSSGPLGLVVSPLTRAQEQQAGVEGGLVVERAQGPAARAGIQRGDIVLAVNDDHVETVQQFKELLEPHRGETIALLVQRNGNALYVSVPMPS